MANLPVATIAEHPPVAAQPQWTMCLLHGDFHVMDQDCWSATVDFYIEHQHLEQPEARAVYQAEVERKMLDRIVRAHLATDDDAEDDTDT